MAAQQYSASSNQARYPPPPQAYQGGYQPQYQSHEQHQYTQQQQQQQQQYPQQNYAEQQYPQEQYAQQYPAQGYTAYPPTGYGDNTMARSQGQQGYAPLGEGGVSGQTGGRGGYQSTGATPANRPAYAPNASASSSSSPPLVEDPEDAELTEEERIEYEKGIITWDKAKHPGFWFRREWLWYYVGFVFLVVIVALMAFFHHDIINWLTPFVRKLQNLRVGWLIPVAILFVLSFPPLFGNEIVMILVGVVWGLGVGFAIAAVGTMLGEIANFFVFKFWCSARAHRMTKKSLNYACLSQAIVEGGWVMAIMVRLSAVPTHFTTVVFAVCGLKFWHFGVALIAGLPKQLLAVYVGVVLARNNGQKNNVVSDAVWGATALISLFTLWYIYRAMLRVRKKVLVGMRHDLQKHHIKTSEPPIGGDDDAVRSWGAPYVQGAVTEPVGAQYAPNAHAR